MSDNVVLDVAEAASRDAVRVALAGPNRDIAAYVCTLLMSVALDNPKQAAHDADVAVAVVKRWAFERAQEKRR